MTILINRDLSLSTRIRIVASYIFSNLPFDINVWTYDTIRILQAFEMWNYNPLETRRRTRRC